MANTISYGPVRCRSFLQKRKNDSLTPATENIRLCGIPCHGDAADRASVPDGGPWIGGNTRVSKWLTPFQDESQSLDPVTNGVYVWTLVFDLTGFDTSVGFIQGRWAADNFGSVWLNGEQIGVSARLHELG